VGHRNKRRVYAQAMLVGISQLTHNLVIWTRNRLAQVDPRWAHYGVQRMVRDVFQILGCLYFDDQGQRMAAQLNPASPLAVAVMTAFPLPL
jgi:hypothetical protein